jgi:hypothetical protein
MVAKICFITAIYGNYESCCKPFKKQSVETDFICFTDSPTIVSNGWIIDTTPYHYENPSPLDDGQYVNSFSNNKHNFNIAKYYKQSFRFIPRLAEYDVVVWVDGTIEITNSSVSSWIMDNINDKKIIGWEHERRSGRLIEEVIDSSTFHRYCSSFWNNQAQPVQDVLFQYSEYLKDGYNDTDYYKKLDPERANFGVWLTCFVAFLQKDEYVKEFLDLWYLQTLKYSTQDQIGFPYVCQKTGLIPYTLPDKEIGGDRPHDGTDFYHKHNHY